MALLCGTMAVLSAVGTSCLVNTLTSTTWSIYNSVQHLAQYDQPGIDDVINQLQIIDISHTIEIIEDIVKLFDDDDNLPLHIKKAVYGIETILDKIQRNLVKIDEAIVYHRTKFFGKWRVFSCDCHIDTIKQYNKLLNKRYNLLFDCLKVNYALDRKYNINQISD